MNDFNNRISAQRAVLELVNASRNYDEELFGLSKKAINRWKESNGVESDSKLLSLLISAAEALFFLANRSQEQITDEYRSASNKYSDIVELIRIEVATK